MTNCPIPNFAKVDDRLWRGSIIDTQEKVDWLVAQGVRTVINLELIHKDMPFPPSVATISLRDWEALPLIAPTYEDKHIHAFLGAVRVFTSPICGHCHEGINRTSVAIAAYELVDLDRPLPAVLAEMRSYNGLWYKSDAAYITKLAARVKEFRP